MYMAASGRPEEVAPDTRYIAALASFLNDNTDVVKLRQVLSRHRPTDSFSRDT